MKRTVYALQVTCNDFDLFEQIISDTTPTNFQRKVVEISFVESTEQTITGIFITTLKNNLPPQHQPGDETDFSAIPIPEGKGLAYPNAFLYDKQRNIILLEANTLGMNDKLLERFFLLYDTQHETHLECKFHPVTTTDFLERLLGLKTIGSVELTIADPLQLFQRSETALANIQNIATENNADKSITIKLKATKGNSLSLELIPKLRAILHLNNQENAQIKCKAKGAYYNDDDNLVETTIDLLIDRFKSSFELSKQEEVTIQANERKIGIRSCYQDLLRNLQQHIS